MTCKECGKLARQLFWSSHCRDCAVEEVSREYQRERFALLSKKTDWLRVRSALAKSHLLDSDARAVSLRKRYEDLINE